MFTNDSPVVKEHTLFRRLRGKEKTDSMSRYMDSEFDGWQSLFADRVESLEILHGNRGIIDNAALRIKQAQETIKACLIIVLNTQYKLGLKDHQLEAGQVGTTFNRYENTIVEVNENIYTYFEQILFADQADIENQILLTYQTAPSDAIEQLTAYTAYWATKAWQYSLGNDISGLSENNYMQILKNYPNPFNNQTTIEYTIPYNSMVELKVYNTKGQIVNLLLREKKNKGEYSFTWDGTDEKGNKVTSGVYFYRLTLDGIESYNDSILLIK